MADTFTDLLRIRKQQTGANRNTWGGLLNSDALELLEKAIAGKQDITVAGTDVTLTTANGADDQARKAILNLIGTPGAARNIIVPQKSKLYVVSNATGSTMTITTGVAASDEVDVDDGVTTLVMCNGTDVTEIRAAQPGQAEDSARLGGVLAASYARLDTSQDFAAGMGFVPSELSMGASVTPDLNASNVFTGVLTADTTIQTPTEVPAAAAQLFFFHIQQAGAGGPWTLAFSAFYDFLGYDPVMPADADASILVQCLYLPELGKALCWSVEELAEDTLTIELSHNEDNVDLFRRLGSPSGIVTVNVTVAAGVVIGSRSTLKAALDMSGGFAAGSVINLTNLGYIVGRGGKGGNGCISMDADSAEPISLSLSRDGKAGGDAIRGPGASNTLNITNANGQIWGGGGGGGGGGASTGADHDVAAGGAGGGGAGFGPAGQGIHGDMDSSAASASSDATDGTLNLDGTNSGGAGSAGNTGGGGSAGAGGAGGDFGANGTNGTAASAGSAQVTQGSGGTAGKAVEVNSATVSFVSGSSSPHVKGAVS